MKKHAFIIIIITFFFYVPQSAAYSNEYFMNFENSDITGITFGERVEKNTEEGTYCYKIDSSDKEASSTIFFDNAKSGIVSVSMDVYFENNTNAFCVSLRNSDNSDIIKLRFVNQEIMIAYTSDDGGVTTSVIDLSVVSEPCTWSKYTFWADTNDHLYKLFRNNVPVVSEWIPFYRTGNDIKSIFLESGSGSAMYIDNVNVHNFIPLEAELSSEQFIVDNTYEMITNIPFGTEVQEFIGGISSGYNISVYDRLGNLKSEGEVSPDDTLYVSSSSGNEYTYYSLGLTNDTYDYNSNFDVITASKVLYVSPTGDDANRGTIITRPFKTLQRCAKYISNYKTVDKDIVIYMRGGIYEYSDVNAFTESCRLINGGKIVIQPYNNEKVIITGGKSILPEEFASVTDEAILGRLSEKAKSNVLEYDMSEIDSSLLGERVMSGWNLSFVPSRFEFYKNTEIQTLARYPNSGTVSSLGIVNPDSAYQLNSGSEYGKFIYSDTKAESWKEPEKAWIWSHFGVGYGGHDIPIGSVDKENDIITVAGRFYQSPKKDFNYYYDNVLEELDTPGEWYYDDTSGKLYYYPDKDFYNSTFYISLLKDNVLSFYDLDNIYINNISFIGAKGDILGFYNCNNILIENCTVGGAGMNGIVISGGRNNNVVGCEVSNTGGDAIKLYGGNIYTLTAANSGVYNCVIHDFSKRKKAYTGGVTVSGTGLIIKNNQIYDAPHLGIQLRGNDILTENNCLENLVYNSKDMGAIYTYNNYVWRGNSILNNRFENIRNIDPQNSPNLSKCVFLDNYSSGYNVKNNIFINCDEGVHTNGGRYNRISENIFYNTDKALIMNNFINICEPPYSSLKTVPVNSTLWKNKYEGIEKTVILYPGYPYGSEEGNNLFLNYPVMDVWDRDMINVTDNIYLSEADYNNIMKFKRENNISEISMGTNCINEETAEEIKIIKDSNFFEGIYEMSVGETAEFDFLITGKSGKTGFIPVIKSLNEDVASVDSSFCVTANKTGTAVIMLTYKNLSASFKVCVVK